MQKLGMSKERQELLELYNDNLISEDDYRRVNLLYKKLEEFDSLEKNQSEVTISGVCQIKKGVLHEYQIKSSYSDIVLLISMLYDYLRMLDDLRGFKAEYYKQKFRHIAESFGNCIDYDYEAMLIKCNEKTKDKDDRLDENWIGA